MVLSRVFARDRPVGPYFNRGYGGFIIPSGCITNGPKYSPDMGHRCMCMEDFDASRDTF